MCIRDRLKDTAGPALNPMIKVVNLVSLIIAPIVVRYDERNLFVVIIILALVALLGWAVMRSKRPAEPIGAPTATTTH